MSLVYIVMGLAMLQYLYFGIAVGGARGRYGIKAPATTGNEVFERYFRVQMNTLEQLIIFVPSMLLFARYVNVYVAAALGVVFLIGRALYFRGYVKAPQARHVGFTLTAVANLALLIGAIIGAIAALSVRS